MSEKAKLIRISLKGFKTLVDVAIDFRDLNVLIGPNGSGKSNLIAFFHMLNAFSSFDSAPVGSWRRYVAEQGGAGSFLHDGPKCTQEIEAKLLFATPHAESNYDVSLSFGAGDDLNASEMFYEREEQKLLGVSPEECSEAREVATSFLHRMVAYHFNDTSREARVKRRSSVDDNVHLRYDAGNLAPFLLNLRERYPRYYRLIVNTIQQVAPFFEDFVFEPEGEYLLLRWREQGTEVVFNPSQASDGTLRAMALIALLLQPPEKLPDLLILDEPELGLHPYGITVIAGLIKAASLDCQVLVATQSPLLLDHFEPADVLVVERNDRRSTYHRLDEERLREWLDEYALSELWHKNILGGRP